MTKQYTVTIDVENGSFDTEAGGDPFAEVARILSETANRLIDGETTQILYDINGNRVGVARFNFDAHVWE